MVSISRSKNPERTGIYHKQGVRYEVATCVNTGHIVWILGPFPCGTHDDRTIYRFGLKRLLLQGEKVWAGGGYRGDPTVLHRFLPDLPSECRREMARGRTRHETIKANQLSL
jgi:hypothetical protein